MLAGIIQTIIMALGIATGNISSNAYKGGNVFNEVKESQTPPIKKASEVRHEINLTPTTTQGAYYSPTISIRKYYLEDEEESLTANYDDPYLNIRNTIYTGVEYSSYTNRYYVNTYLLLEITPYYTTIDNSINFKFSYGLVANSTTETVNLIRQVNRYNSNMSLLIDLTCNDSTLARLTNYMTENANIISTYYSDTNTVQIGTDPNYYETIDCNIPDMTTETRYLGICIRYIISPGNYVEPNYTQINQITFNVKAIVPTANYEVVDIPGMMFTIISLPFSFISTAFNLTLFPGTPYAINFSNLFMVVLATFILMWLIKKVFH